MKSTRFLLSLLLLNVPLATPVVQAVEDGKKKIVFVAGGRSHGTDHTSTKQARCS